MNLEICARFLRTHDVEGEEAEGRTRRLVGAATATLAQEGREVEGVGMLQAAVWSSPWSASAREFLDQARKAVDGIAK